MKGETRSHFGEEENAKYQFQGKPRSLCCGHKDITPITLACILLHSWLVWTRSSPPLVSIPGAPCPSLTPLLAGCAAVTGCSLSTYMTAGTTMCIHPSTSALKTSAHSTLQLFWVWIAAAHRVLTRKGSQRTCNQTHLCAFNNARPS